MKQSIISQFNKKNFVGKTIPLKKICLDISDCLHSTPKWTKKGKIVIRNSNIKNGRLDLSNISYTDNDTFQKRIQRSVPQEGDLIISREAPMGEVCIIPKEIECCLGQRVVLIKPNRELCDNNYLLYTFLSEFVQKQIKKSDSSGSIVSNLCIPDLENLEIQIIPIEEQRKMGKILSNIDRKIELNNKINVELEHIAKTLYNHWFVQFDFPDSNRKHYKISDGEMTYNQVLKREIPKDWKVENITCSKITEIIDTGIRDFPDKNIYISTSEVENSEIINHNITETFKNRPSRADMQPIKNSVWFARMKDTKKIILVSDFSKELIDNYIFSTGFAGIKVSDYALYYIWNFINDNYFEKIKNYNATGSTQKAIINESISYIPLLVPDKDVLINFNLM